MIWWQRERFATLSKSHVSRMSEQLDELVADFKNRPLDPGLDPAGTPTCYATS